MSYRFHLEDGLWRFPLASQHGHFTADHVTSPFHVCNNAQLRREMVEEFDWGPAVPVDIFIMAEGEPEKRDVTKIAGLPYRPAGAKWPTTADGSPLVFLGQFDFSESLDITGALPGDLLLVFADQMDPPAAVHFEWQHRGISDLVSVDGLPPGSDTILPCFGYAFRTVNYEGARRNRSGKYPRCHGQDVWSSYFLTRYHATQIGAAPFFIQDGDDASPGRMLCTLSSVSPSLFEPFPWINHPEPLLRRGEWDADVYDGRLLTLCDLGCIYVFLDETDSLHWQVSSF